MIYYVEDDTNIRDLTVYALKQAGFEAAGFPAAGEFFAACKERLPELVLLDIMLPEIDGLEILHMLRENPATKHLPVMMLTAKGTEFDTVSGLDAGADDQGHVLSRSQLLEDVWGMTYVGETRTVDVHVQTLRQKLAAAQEGADALVRTVRGVGYCIKPSS